MNSHYPEVAGRAKNRCEYCRAPEQAFNFSFEVEHIVPTSRRGINALANLALACRACNLHKSDAIAGPDAMEVRDVRLFHPRRDRWEDHFVFDSENGTIQGLTSIGRATVTRLRMNAAFQIQARRHWVALGLYP